jgi:hypothetical protein
MIVNVDDDGGGAHAPLSEANVSKKPSLFSILRKKKSVESPNSNVDFNDIANNLPSPPKKKQPGCIQRLLFGGGKSNSHSLGDDTSSVSSDQTGESGAAGGGGLFSRKELKAYIDPPMVTIYLIYYTCI